MARRFFATPFTVDVIAPSVPSGVSATALSTTTIRIAWSASTDTGGSGLAGYRVFRSTTSGGALTQIGGNLSVGTLSFDDTSLSASTTRYYRVVAFDGRNNVSANSTEVSATTQSGGASTLTPAIAASRISGPAPLGVVFNSVGTTSSAGIDTFRQVSASFNFADAGSGTWSTSGRSKNVERGAPIASHVFETAGTYVVKVGLRDGSGGASDGHTAQTQITITVLEPDTYWSTGGRTTVCLSRNTDHAGAPAGATLVSNVSSWSASTFASNTRVLLHAGQDFSSLGTIGFFTSGTGGRTNLTIGRYSSGADPIVGGIVGGADVGFGVNGFTVMNLNTNNINPAHSCTNVLLLRNNLRGTGSFLNLINVGDTTTGLIAVENTFPNNPEYHYFGALNNGALMGNSFSGTVIFHPVRITMSQIGFVGHNAIGSCAPDGRHNLKVHSNGMDASTETRFLRIANNPGVGNPGDPLDWSFALCPQRDGIQELLRDVLAEENTWDCVPSAFELAICGARMTSRANGSARIGRGHTEVAGGTGPYFNVPSQLPFFDPV